MTTFVAFAWGFGTCAAASIVLVAASRRRWRKPSPIRFTEPQPLTDEQYNELKAKWADAISSARPGRVQL